MTTPDDNTPLPDDSSSRESAGEQPTLPVDGEVISSFSQPAEESKSDAPQESIHLAGLENTPESDFDFPQLDEDVEAFRRELNARQLPPVGNDIDEQNVPGMNLSPRRRRRSAGITDRLSSMDVGDRTQSIVLRASPTVDFFIFTFLSACILAAGYFLDAPAILMIGVFVSPLWGSLAGVGLATALGEFRFFRQSLGGMLATTLIVFGVGVIAGYFSRFAPQLTYSLALQHARLWWPDLLMLVIGTAALVIGFIQSDEKPVIPGLMLAYVFYLPVSAAGFGLGSGVEGLWPQAALVYLIHLAVSLFISLVIFLYMGFRPVEVRGYALLVGLTIFGILVMGGFSGLNSFINIRGDEAYATVIVVDTATPTWEPTSTLKPSSTPGITRLPSLTPRKTIKPVVKATLTPAFSATVVLSPTTFVTLAPTLVPTPFYGLVFSPISDGVLVRVRPGGPSITTVQNGYLAQILSDPPIVLDGFTWIHVLIRAPNGDIDGWVLEDLIQTATPSP
jgi:uncharacterized membrane protein